MSKFTKIAIWAGVILLLLNFVGTIIIPIYQQKKTKKVNDLRVKYQAERLYRLKIEADNTALEKFKNKIISDLEKAGDEYEKSKDIDYSDMPYDSLYMHISDWLDKR